MIDWFKVFSNSLWILGLALMLAVLSHAAWQASTNKEKLRTRLGHPDYQRAIDIAAVLFCSGMAATSRSTWEIILWSGLGILFIAQAVAEKFARKA